MKNRNSKNAQSLLSLVFAITFSLIICSSSYGQIGLANEQLTFNNFNSFPPKSDKPLAVRPRIVGKTNRNEGQAIKSEIEANITISKPVSDQPDTNNLISELEHQAFDILNQRRRENGLAPLRWNEDMARVARLHSQDMAKYNYFSHSGRDGTMVNDRADILGISDWRAIGENIAYSRGYNKPAELACDGWMKSPGHRENILSVRWKEAGMGAALAADGSYYFTEVFISR